MSVRSALRPAPVALAVQAHHSVAQSATVYAYRPDQSTASLARAAHAVVCPQRQRQLADLYDAAPDWDDDAVPAFEAFRRETLTQWAALQRLGWSLTVESTDPYADAPALRADVARGRIAVLSTAATGGHPFLSDHENDVFRAVHDVIAHCATGRGFDRHGEEAAYQAHAALYSGAARRALAVETRAQNAYLITRGQFGPQKVCQLPAVWSDDRTMTPSAAELPDAVADAVARHN